MDLKFITESLPFNAYNQSREQEVVNQQRVAQATQMLEEARLKAEMQPYDIEYKKAMTQELRDRALKYAQEGKDSNVKRQQEAAAIQRLMQGRDTMGALETALQFPADVSAGGPNLGAYLDRLIAEKRIRPDVAQRLRPDGQTNLYTNENIRSIIESLAAEDPERAKTARIGMQQEGAQKRVETQGQTAVAVANIRAAVDREVAAMKGEAAKAAKGPMEQGNRFYDQALTETDPTLKQFKLEQAQYFYNLALQQGRQAAAERKSGGVDVGAVSELPTVPAPAPAAMPPGAPKKERKPLSSFESK